MIDFIFTDIVAIPWAKTIEGGTLESAYFGFVSYKIGVGKNRK